MARITQVPMYYFDIDENGESSRDMFGVELANLYEARDQALSLLPDLASDRAVNGEHRTITAVVRCYEGRQRYRTTLTVDGEWIEPPDYPEAVND